MRILLLTIFCLATFSVSVRAEITETDDASLAIYGSACEDIKSDTQNASTRLKATDKACFNAVSSLPEIIDIKSSFDDHDYNVMIYTIVDEYIEDLTTKTIKQDDSQICVEVTGYITPENIGKAIDNTIHQPSSDEVAEKQDTPSDAKEDVSVATNKSSPAIDESTNFVVLSTIYVKPTEFYNNTVSSTHSNILKNILSQNDLIRIVNDESEANFIITPKVLKAKIEQLNTETNRMQMVVALETFDKNSNSLVSEHQNKLIMFSSSDDEQTIAKNLLKKLFEQGSLSISNLVSQSNKQTLQQQDNSILAARLTAHSSTDSGESASLPAE